ncbi:hypothetical protein GBA52_012329 [Prunus armeniaca]|nr:hypothetical protein GBA52_012329 [Prunus armeniaca]
MFPHSLLTRFFNEPTNHAFQTSPSPNPNQALFYKPSLPTVTSSGQTLFPTLARLAKSVKSQAMVLSLAETVSIALTWITLYNPKSSLPPPKLLLTPLPHILPPHPDLHPHNLVF